MINNIKAARFGQTRIVVVCLGVVCVWQSFRYFTAPHEDWEMASNAIAERTQKGACVTAVPPDGARLYEFFRPELGRARCEAPSMVLAVTPYASGEQRERASGLLRAAGYRQTSAISVGGSEIVCFVRP